MSTPPNSTDAEVGRRINAALTNTGTTARTLSDVTGISYATLRRSLAGGRSLTIREISNIADALNIHPAALLPRTITKDAA